jgi:uridine monophosphate synthetase
VPYEIRAETAPCKVAKLLLELMARKKSNLCVAADVLNASELVALAKKVGPHICLLKTHADLVQGFTQKIADDLISLAKQHDFLILEDR